MRRQRRSKKKERGITLLEMLIPLFVLALAVTAAVIGGVRGGSPFVIIGLFVAGLLALPVLLVLLSSIGNLVERIVNGPDVPPRPCERGCPAAGLTPERIEESFVWRCPCGLSYVMRAPSFGVHEMRCWTAGEERPYLRRRFWWRWRRVEARQATPYR